MIAYAGWCRREAAQPRAAAHRREAALAARRVDASQRIRRRTDVDKIFLRELKVETIIGFWEWERRIKQIVSIDLEIGTDARIAASSETVAGTLNYEVLAKRLVEYVGRFAASDGRGARDARSARIVIREFGAPWVKVSVAKPGAIPAAREVGHRDRAQLRATMPEVLVGIGSNADPVRGLRAARSGARAAVRCVASLVRVSQPPSIGVPGPDYLNMVVALPRPSRPSRSGRCATRCARSRHARAGGATIPPSARSTSISFVMAPRRCGASACRGPACSRCHSCSRRSRRSRRSSRIR